MVGTLGVDRYLGVVDSIRKLLTQAGKKAYTFVVGKLNPAKLANFAEVEVFCLVACPENSILEDARDYHVPIVTPFEMEIALGVREWDGSYSVDFRDLRTIGQQDGEDDEGEGRRQAGDEGDDEEDDDRPYFSLVSGSFKVKAACIHPTRQVGAENQQLIAYSSPAADFLQSREYRGLGHDSDASRGEIGDEVEGVVEGQTGIASDYGEAPISEPIS